MGVYRSIFGQLKEVRLYFQVMRVLVSRMKSECHTVWDFILEHCVRSESILVKSESSCIARKWIQKEDIFSNWVCLNCGISTASTTTKEKEQGAESKIRTLTVFCLPFTL